MLDIDETELVFSFPDVDAEAYLRIRFHAADRDCPAIRIEGDSRSPLRLAQTGSFVIRLEPDHVRRGCDQRSLRYPFALMITVGGKNAITGTPSASLDRSPQNYFTTPPQGGIDGYFRDGRVFPFRAACKDAKNMSRLDLRVFPMKKKAMDYFWDRTYLIPGPGPSALSGITLLHGGERYCEPIYEDVCNLGTWDALREERVSLWIASASE
jgi:hypothetical protein